MVSESLFLALLTMGLTGTGAWPSPLKREGPNAYPHPGKEPNVRFKYS